MLEQVRALPEVEAAAGTILDLSGDANQAKILDREGKAIQGNNPTFGLGVDPEDERFNPFKLVEGDWASGPDEVVIDVSTADEQGFKVGDTVKVAGEGPVRALRAHRDRPLRRRRQPRRRHDRALRRRDGTRRCSAKDGFDAIAVGATRRRRPGAS